MELSGVSISEFEPSDLGPVVDLLAACMPAEGITEETFTRRVLLDPWFEAGLAFVARREHRVLGFILAVAPRSPAAEDPPERRGWITLFAVAAGARRRGIGGQLLAGAEHGLRTRRCAAVWVSPYGPGYWIPGVDEAAYPEALGWLLKRGYTLIARPLSMELKLHPNWSLPADAAAIGPRLRAQGVVIQPFSPASALPLLRLAAAEFGPDWERIVRGAMDAILAGYQDRQSLWTAMRGGTCIGFVHTSGARFGPIGVARAERGRRIGMALMAAALDAMHRSGQTRAYFLWTSDATADRFYRPIGFREVRRFQVLARDLTE